VLLTLLRRPALLAIVLSAATTAAAAEAAAATTATTATKAPTAVLAKAKGLEITRKRLDEAVVAFRAQSAGEGREIPKDRETEIESVLLDRIVTVQLLNNLANDAEKKAAEDRAEKMFAQIRSQAPTPSVFEAQLKAAGMTADHLKLRIREQSISEAVVEREVASKISIPGDAVKKFYEENPKYFEAPERVRASHVLIATLDASQQELAEDKKKEKHAVAEKVLARARKGDDFAALAKEFSEDPGSKDTGGEYTFPRGQMVKEFEEAAFSLKPGGVSDIVTTKFGYHIIKLSEKLPAGKEPLEKAQENIKKHLTQEELQKRLPEFYEKVKKDAGLEILDPSLVPAKPAKA
jgi:peptidyl-prolyl cis-trans isomerase C